MKKTTTKTAAKSTAETTGRRCAPLIVLIVLAILATACGVPLDATAHALPAVKFNRSATSSTTTTTNPTSTHQQKSYSVYFLLRGVLTPVSRPDPSTTSPVTPPIAIASLDNGPNAVELSEGYASALSQASGAQVSVVGVANGVLTIALNSNFVNLLLGPTLPQAYGQIVLTLVKPQFPNVNAVEFVYDGAKLAVLLPDGAIEAGPAKLCDYASIAVASIRRKCGSTT